MNYNKKTVRDVDVAGKKVLLRCDFNVPQDKETGAITSDKRIVAALPTIRYLLDNGAAVIACSHLGKPVATFESYVKKQVEKGKDASSVKKEDWEKSLKKLTLAPVAQRLSELLGQEVIFAHDVVGEDAKAKAAALKPGQILLLENTRFEKGETKNDPELAKAMASMADLYVSDAFAATARSQVVKAGEIPDGWEGLDIGPETVKLYCDAVADAGTVIWNGPMGVFEFPAFAKGTEAVAEALSKTSAITIIGGGDSAAAVEQLGYADKMTHISTGGGASLEFLEGKELPGVACLLDA